MPYPNFHAFRLKNPDLFLRIRIIWQKQGIMAYGGPLKSDPRGGVVVQAIRFNRKKWTYAESKKWMKDHKYEVILSEKASESK
jgi:hypothetical protein